MQKIINTNQSDTGHNEDIKAFLKKLKTYKLKNNNKNFIKNSKYICQPCGLFSVNAILDDYIDKGIYSNLNLLESSQSGVNTVAAGIGTKLTTALQSLKKSFVTDSEKTDDDSEEEGEANDDFDKRITEDLVKDHLVNMEMKRATIITYLNNLYYYMLNKGFISNTTQKHGQNFKDVVTLFKILIQARPVYKKFLDENISTIKYGDENWVKWSEEEGLKVYSDIFCKKDIWKYVNIYKHHDGTEGTVLYKQQVKIFDDIKKMAFYPKSANKSYSMNKDDTEFLKPYFVLHFFNLENIYDTQVSRSEAEGDAYTNSAPNADCSNIFTKPNTSLEANKEISGFKKLIKMETAETAENYQNTYPDMSFSERAIHIHKMFLTTMFIIDYPLLNDLGLIPKAQSGGGAVNDVFFDIDNNGNIFATVNTTEPKIISLSNNKINKILTGGGGTKDNNEILRRRRKSP